MYNAKLIDACDNVVVAIYEIPENKTARYLNKAEQEEHLTVLDAIPIFHKIARTDIAKGSPILKYGQVIGIAKTDIPAGTHVHTHNVADKQEV